MIGAKDLRVYGIGALWLHSIRELELSSAPIIYKCYCKLTLAQALRELEDIIYGGDGQP